MGWRKARRAAMRGWHWLVGHDWRAEAVRAEVAVIGGVKLPIRRVYLGCGCGAESSFVDVDLSVDGAGP